MGINEQGPTPHNDLDKLDALERRMTQGTWINGYPSGMCINPSHLRSHPGSGGPNPCVFQYHIDTFGNNSRCISLLPKTVLVGFTDEGPVLNAADAAGIVAIRNAYRDLAREIRELRADKAALTAKLAQAKQAGREACWAATHDRDDTTAQDIERVLATLEAL